ncbi:hypothetical protein BH09MYX1_BH09MYX1_60230 [soil metagenome]
MKLPKHATSVGLVIAAAALGLYVYADRETVSDSERAMRPKNVFPAFRRDTIDRIEITKGDKKLVLERELGKDGGDPSWKITQPEALGVEPEAVDRLMGVLEFATYLRKVDAEAKVAFDAPRLTGSIRMGKVTFKFVLGAAAPTPEGAAYLRVEGEGDYVVSKELVAALMDDASAYRSRNVVPYLSIDLNRLEITSAAQSWAIERVDEVVFRMEDSKLRAARENLDKVWMAFADMRADGFVSDDEAKAATEHPAFTIKMTPKDATRANGELLVGGPCAAFPDDVVVRRIAPSPLAACVPKIVLQGLATPKAELIDTKLFVARPDEAEEVLLEPLDGTGAKIDMARKGTGWHVRSPFDRDLASDEVDMASSLVGALTRGLGTDVALIDPKAAFTLKARASIVRFENQGTEVVDIGTNDKGQWIAHRKMDGAAVTLGAELARKARPTAIALRGRTVLSPALDPKDVKALSLRCGTEQDVARGPNGFGFAAPAGYAADGAATLDLIDTMTKLTADGWIADTDDGTFGFVQTNCKLQLLTDTRIVTIIFGREGEGGVYARVEDGTTKSPVFVTAKPLRDVAAKILVDRSGFSVDVGRAESLSLVQPKTRLDLAPKGGKLEPFDASVAGGVDALLGTISALRADDVAHLGAPTDDEGFDKPALEITAKLGGDGGVRTLRLVFGRATIRHNQSMYFARIDGVRATYLVARERVDAILGGF